MSKTNIQKPRDFNDIKVIEELGNSTYPVYLTHAPKHEEYYALKVFPYKQNKITISYMNEVRFAKLSHPNLIKIVHFNPKQKSSQRDKVFYTSFILMELAPFGDFTTIVNTLKDSFNTIIARTYFHQLVEVMDFLHSQEIAHLDVKLDNLLLGDDLMLRLTDFDNSHVSGDSFIKSRGSANYRAPELANDQCQDCFAADIYSMGIVLFAFMTKKLPYLEGKVQQGTNMYEVLLNKPHKFWDELTHVHQDFKVADYQFKDLFMAMCKKNPAERITLEEIKKSDFYRGPILNKEGLQQKVGKLMSKIQKQKK